MTKRPKKDRYAPIVIDLSNIPQAAIDDHKELEAVARRMQNSKHWNPTTGILDIKKFLDEEGK